MSDTTRGQPVPDGVSRPRIVVGVDGSDHSIAALRRAKDLAEQSAADLDVVTSWRFPPVMPTLELMMSPTFKEIAESQQAAALESVFGENVPGWVHPIIVEGNAAAELIERTEGAELLVVGSRGYGGFKGLLLGSVSSECAAHAKSPVLIMRGGQV